MADGPRVAPALHPASQADLASVERTFAQLSGDPDQQILDHEADLRLLGDVAAGRVRTDPGNRMDLRRLACDELILTGFGTGAVSTPLPRGERILSAARGEIALPPEL